MSTTKDVLMNAVNIRRCEDEIRELRRTCTDAELQILRTGLVNAADGLAKLTRATTVAVGAGSNGDEVHKDTTSD